LTTFSLRSHHGDNVEVESFTATAAKNSFGQVLDLALSKGMVAITRRQKPRAILLALDQYEALVARVEDPLETLREEFDALVARMQTPKAKKAGATLFAESGRRQP
jgi:antitoxin Phd